MMTSSPVTGWRAAGRTKSQREVAMNFNSIMIGSEDPKRLVDYYTKILGKPAMSEGGYDGWQIGSGWITIGPHDEVKGKNPTPGRLILNIESEDVKGDFEKFRAADAEVVRRLVDVGPHSEDAIQRLERRPRPPARRKPTSTRPVSERPSLLGKPHAGLRAESSRSLSSFCSIPPEDWPESGRDQGPQPTFRTGSERFARFWSSLSTVRDREAPGSDPGPPTNPLRARRAKRLNFGRVRIVQ